MSLLDAEEQWKEVFALYDQDKDGYISKADFAAAVRVLGKRYTLKQMEEKTKSMPNSIDYDAYFSFLCDPYDGPKEEDLLNALRAFEDKDDEVTVSQLTLCLTTMGDKLPADQARLILDGVPQTAPGRVKIDDAMRYFMPPVPSATPNVAELLRELIQEEVNRKGFVDDVPPPPPEEEDEDDEQGAEGKPRSGAEDNNSHEDSGEAEELHVDPIPHVAAEMSP